MTNRNISLFFLFRFFSLSSRFETGRIMSSEKSIFERPFWVVVFALSAAISWGWAYPLIKLGFEEFGIAQSMTGSKMLFAGIRFFISGILILAIARLFKRDFKVKSNGGRLYILMFALLNTTLHYAFFYIGLSHSDGARAAILNSLGVFMLVLLACIFFKSDKLTVKKMIGCIIGFVGILSLNLGKGSSGCFTMMGDGMIIMNALCSAFAGLMTRGLSKHVDVFVGTGYSLATGGALLVLPGLLLGGNLPHITLYGFVLLGLLVCISTLGFTLYNKLLSCNPVGKVAIFNSLIPVVGAITSCICLSEPFYWKYALAAGLAMAGIYIINKR